VNVKRSMCVDESVNISSEMPNSDLCHEEELTDHLRIGRLQQLVEDVETSLTGILTDNSRLPNVQQ